MKKIFNIIFNIIKKFFLFLWNILEKSLILPLSKLVYGITSKVKFNTSGIERFLSRPQTLIYVSLFFAILAFWLIDSNTVSFVETEALVLSDQKVEVTYNDEAYVIEGIPESVDITLMGNKSALYLAKQLGEHTITLDLSSCTEGTCKVKLAYDKQVKSLDYKLDPSTVTVYVYPKVSSVRTLTTDVVNADKLDSKLIVSSVTMSTDEVIVKSHKEKLATVASVKALVDVSNLGITGAGTYTAEKVTLVAYDENGAEIEGIEIVPGTVSAEIVVTSPKKDVPINVVPTGTVKPGTAIKSITSSISQVTIYGEQSVLDKINAIDVEIDVNNLDSNKSYKATIKKPSGVKYISASSVTVKVAVETQTSKDFEDIQIEIKGLNDKYSAMTSEAGASRVTVTVKGVSSILESLNSSDISAYIDLTDYKPGTYDVPIEATGTDVKLTYVPKTTTVSITIKEK